MSVKLRNPGDTYGTCTHCGMYAVHRDHHTCKPEWRVRVERDSEDSAEKVFGRDPKEAAENFCEQFDSDLDYSIIRNGEATLIVERDGKEVRVEIEAESRPHYSASEITP